MTPDTAAVQGYTPEWFAGLSDSTLARTLEQARKEMVAKRKEYEDATNRTGLGCSPSTTGAERSH